jgi:hypothetical protein
LSPFGRFSPLSPNNVFNPLRTVTHRKPPKQALDDSHHSLLAELYGDTFTLDVAPFPNMEWWWNAAECSATRGDEERKLSIITNVHLFALPIVGLVAQGTLAIRDKTSGKTWQIHSKGELSAGADCRFEASGWQAYRHPKGYVFKAVQGELEANLAFGQGKVACFGDLNQPPGWYDNNPKGLIPYWASYRSRFGNVSGTLVLDADQDVPEQIWTLVPGKSHSRFDHQSLHWSARDVGAYSLPVLAEALITRPRWSWFHLRLNDELSLMAYELCNGHTATVLKRAAAINDDAGRVALIGDDALSFRTSGKRGSKDFEIHRIDLTVKDAPVSAWDGDYQLDVERGQVPQFTVDYPVFDKFRYRAQELCVQVKGSQRNHGKTQRLRGEGVEEVFDMFSSFGRGR